MSYAKIRAELERLRARFRQDVFDYLDATGRSEEGRTYFGLKAAKNPRLIERLEEGKMPNLDVMIRVWDFIAENPASDAGKVAKEEDTPLVCPLCGQELPK